MSGSSHLTTKRGAGRKELLYVGILGLVTMIVSMYLVYDHISDPESSFCDVGDLVSCSKVRRSVFSEIYNVPIAIFGLLFNFVTTIGALQAVQSDSLSLISALFYWNVFGCIFVVYLICAEIFLHALCPFCTVVHICQVISMVLMYKVSEKRPIYSIWKTIWDARGWLILIGLMNVIPMLYFNLSVDFIGNVGNEPTITNEEFAKCITQEGWRFYGLVGCSWCERQKLLFGKTFRRISFFDCGTHAEVCRDELKVDAYPTWIKFDDAGNEIDRWKGYCSAETWTVLTACKDPFIGGEPIAKK